jgi:DNA-binding CsgD family transcriptional regulator
MSLPLDLCRRPEVPLTNRELQVLRMVGSGKSSKVIAAELSISVHTVCNHRKHICEKLDINSAAELIAYAAGWTARIKNDYP